MPNAAAQPKRIPLIPTGLVYHPDYVKHWIPRWHPEQPARVAAIVEHLKETELYRKLSLITPTPADPEWIAAVHSLSYITHVEDLCEHGGGLLDDGDTPVCPDSYDVALLSAGGALAACDAVLAGQARNAFAVIRPPGHHARPDGGMGFCIFNNVAIAARYLQRKNGLARILIVDWDVHHGNGTQEAFYEDPTVLVLGIHRFPFYPGTGAPDECGRGAGRGYTINLPVPEGTNGPTFVSVLRHSLGLTVEYFQPDFILVSCGFDAHRDDPLGGLLLDDADFGELARVVKRIAEKECGGRLVALLEGGYDLGALGRSVAEVLRAFME